MEVKAIESWGKYMEFSLPDSVKLEASRNILKVTLKYGLV